MAEPTDLMMLILQRIQSDVQDIKRVQAEHGEKLREMNGYLSFNLGITSRHTTEIDSLRDEVAALRQRVSRLEIHE